jgi:hypothetical protein
MLLFAAVAALAFGAGMALRGWSGEGDAATPADVRLVDGPPQSRPIRLVKADPGTLQRRIVKRRAPAAPAPAVVVPAPAPAPAPPAPVAPAPAPVAPAPAPVAPAPAPPAPAPPPPASNPQPDQEFDLRSEPPVETFDSDQ